MKGIIAFLLTAALGTGLFMNVKADALNRHNNVHFTVLAPKKVNKDWKLHMQAFPDGKIPRTNKIVFRFMDHNQRNLILGIEERKQDAPLTAPKGGEKVHFNGQTGFFIKWDNSGEINRQGQTVKGGLLIWNQDGTHIRMGSAMLTKAQMIKLAASCKKLS